MEIDADGPIRQGRRFGIWSRSTLEDVGYTARQIQRELESGKLKRVIRGWYCEPDADPDFVTAVRRDAQIGCLSACQHHGLWVPPKQDLHLLLRPGAHQKASGGVVFHRGANLTQPILAPLEDALHQVARHHEPENALIVVESALATERIGEAMAEAILAGISSRRSKAAKPASTLSQSGSETRVRLELRSLRVPHQQQVKIPGVGIVDFLVGESLIIEADSAEHHSGPAEYERDRQRDAASRGLGYDTVRLSYSQIWKTWDATRELLRAVLKTRRYRRAPRPLGFS